MDTVRRMDHDNPARENLVDWLRDAHAMEMQAKTMLKGQAGRLEHYPDVKARVEKHVRETQQQARTSSNA